MGLFSSSKSSSVTSTTVQNYDDDAAAYDGSNIVSATGQGNVIIGSDELAALTLASNKDALALATDLISETLGKAFSSTDNRAAAAENNLAAAQAAAKETIQKGQESSDDRLIKIVMGIGALAAFYIWRTKK